MELWEFCNTEGGCDISYGQYLFLNNVQDKEAEIRRLFPEYVQAAEAKSYKLRQIIGGLTVREGVTQITF